MDGKLVIITGANSGIGFETAKELARQNAKVIMACRNVTKAEEARKQIVEATKNENVHVKPLDLSSFKSIREFAADINSTEQHLDVLIHNAGMVGPAKREVTEDGLEYQFQTNHLGPFLLNHLLLDLVKQTRKSRIVVTSSVAHKYGSMKKFEDLQSEKKYDPNNIYYMTKLANILFTKELAKKLEGTETTANCLHPGVVNTNFGSNLSGVFKYGVKLITPFMKSQKDGAKTTIFLATSPKVDGVTGKYFDNCKEACVSKEAKDPDLAIRLWEISEELTGITQRQ